MQIRKAKLSDAKAISTHLFLAMEDVLYEFIGVKNADLAKSFLFHFVQKECNQYSFQNCWVAQIENEVVASINIYDGANLNELQKPIVDYIQQNFNRNFIPEKETQSGEFYIDTFGVAESKQGQGIGAKLLQFVIDEYVVKQNFTLGLLVGENNLNAEKLYLRFGFIWVGNKSLVGKQMKHLQINSQSSFFK